jgi:hypothetical protein
MGYLFGGGQVVVGIGVIMAWWLALKLDRLRLGGRPLSRMGFAVVPTLFLLWFLAGALLIVLGLGIV